MMLVLLNILKSYRISIVSKVFKCVNTLSPQWMDARYIGFSIFIPLDWGGVIHETKFGT